jgi:hypothetical protein
MIQLHNLYVAGKNQLTSKQKNEKTKFEEHQNNNNEQIKLDNFYRYFIN